MQDFNIVQVGSFAQQATGDAAPITPWLHSSCHIPPLSLTVNCPYQGLPAPQASHHVTLHHSGTYRGSANQLSPYTQNGHHDVVVCDVVVDGAVYVFDGTLTHIKETRRGDVTPDPNWQEPRGWLGIEDVERHQHPNS
jgi:hypothetical protein